MNFSFEGNSREETLDLLSKSLREPNIALRHRAADRLIQKFPSQSIPVFREALVDPDWYVRNEAVLALGRLEDKDSIEFLVKALQDPERRVYSTAARVLTDFGWLPSIFEEKLGFYFAKGNFMELTKLGDEAFDFMIKALNDMPRSWDLACKASAALGLLGDRRAVEPLIDTLKFDNITVSKKVAEALGKIGDARAFMPLMKLLEKPDSELQIKAMEALGRLGDGRAVEVISLKLKDRDPEIRLAAAEALSNFSDERAIEPLREIIKKDKNLEIKRIAIRSLGKIKTSQNVSFLIDLYKEDTKELHGALIKALCDLSDAGAIDVFTESLESDEPQIRFLAAGALGKLKDKRALPFLIKTLDDSDWRVCSEAIKALGRLALPEAAEKLKTFLFHKRSYIRQLTARALWSVGGDGMAELKVALRDSHNYVRFLAAGALDKREWIPETREERADYCFAKRDYGSLISEGIEGISVLLRGLKDNYSIVKESVEGFIISLGSQAEDILLFALEKEDPQIRVAALKLLGELRICEKDILKCLEDENNSVRRTAASVLRGFEPSDFILQALEETLRDTDRGVRSTAEKTIDKLKKYKEDGIKPGIKIRICNPVSEDFSEFPLDKEFSYDEMSATIKENSHKSLPEGSSVMELCNKRQENYYPEKHINIVLFEPRIPPNTGNIARLCAGTGSNLFLVGKLGFSLRDRELKRAGLDYWHLVRMFYYPAMEKLYEDYPDGKFYYFSSNVSRPYTSVSYRSGDFLVFGPERPGLPQDMLEKNSDRTLSIPMWGEARSFNLSTSVGIALYEALRQLNRGWIM